MRPPLDGSHVLITGASSGIGAELVRQLGGRARAISLVARRADRLTALANEMRAAHPALAVTVHACDLIDGAAADAMVDAVERANGPVEVLINNAGSGDFGFYERSSWDKTERMLMLNVVALARLTRRVLPGMTARGRGGILNVSSGLGLEALPGFAAYTGSKHFVSGFSESLRIEQRGRGVVVSQLCPGPVATEFDEISGMNPSYAPSIVRISAARCARVAIRAFSRGRAIILPGAVYKAVIYLGAVSPRWLKRLLFRPLAWQMRRLESRASTPEA